MEASLSLRAAAPILMPATLLAVVRRLHLSDPVRGTLASSAFAWPQAAPTSVSRVGRREREHHRRQLVSRYHATAHRAYAASRPGARGWRGGALAAARRDRGPDPDWPRW